MNIENKEQNSQKPPLSRYSQKPPLSRCRIAGEILAGLAVAVPVLYVAILVFAIVFAIPVIPPGESGGYIGESVVMLLLFAFFAFPILYGPASAIGVYLVGSRGKQTGSFLLTLVAGFLGGCVMLPTLFVTGSVLGGACLALVFLTAPVIATIGFNGTRRYRSKPKEDVETDSSDQEE